LKPLTLSKFEVAAMMIVILPELSFLSSFVAFCKISVYNYKIYFPLSLRSIEGILISREGLAIRLLLDFNGN